MMDVLDILGQDARAKLRKRTQPTWTAPMLATLEEDTFSGPDWIFERKFDGERMLVFRKGRTVRIMSRNKKNLNATYPELVEALRAQDCNDFIADGEVVAFEGVITSFLRLQGRMQIKNAKKARETGIAVYYYLFDLLHVAGHDVTKVPLRDRKRLLKRALSFADPIRFSTHRNEQGEKYHCQACRKGWEGLIAKDARSKYVHSRSRKWLKFKCVHEQEFVIGGFTDPEGSRIGFGALLIGYYEKNKLRYAGMVGTGYNDEMVEYLTKKLKKSECDERQFSEDDLPSKFVHWVRPKLVCQVGFTEWTGSGKLRHPRFLGLRRDKAPREVVREG